MRGLVPWIVGLWSIVWALACTAPSNTDMPTERTAAPAIQSAPPRPEPTASALPIVVPAGTIKPVDPKRPLRVGVTLHPYYSWTKSVAGDGPEVEVRSILPGEVDAGNYQPRPEDIKKLGDLDAIVVNGIGHDDFIGGMIQASGNTHLVVIKPNEATPLLKAARGGAVNSHTFISFTNAVQQTYAIERALAALRPDLAPRFSENAGRYGARLRQIRAEAAKKLADAKAKRVVTVHDGYGYLCQEFGIDVAGVVEPAHGLVPSASELGEMIDLLKREKISIVLSEETFPDKLLGVLKDAAKVNVFIITHIASGAYTADKFEKEMAKNADTLVKALAP
ncbi:Cation ABC transporter, periplasmic cation-binding protein [Minicystis rosea]|nr:Cation ABC transporter, periplasmic cation-binding protein [Minicystis rosea]